MSLLGRGGKRRVFLLRYPSCFCFSRCLIHFASSKSDQRLWLSDQIQPCFACRFGGGEYPQTRKGRIGWGGVTLPIVSRPRRGPRQDRPVAAASADDCIGARRNLGVRLCPTTPDTDTPARARCLWRRPWRALAGGLAAEGRHLPVLPGRNLLGRRPLPRRSVWGRARLPVAFPWRRLPADFRRTLHPDQKLKPSARPPRTSGLVP